MNKIHRGWASMDLGMAILVMILVVSFAAVKYQDYVQENNWQTEAAHTSSYAAAARAYIGRNYSALLAASSTTTPAVITTAMLKATGFLPSGFTETNSEGQHLQTYVVRNGQNTDLLQGMVVAYGGNTYPLKSLIIMAKAIKTGFGGYTTDGQTVTGALRSWYIPLSAYGATSGNGHLAVLLSTDDLSSAQQDNDRLYRFQVNGSPDLNKMHTSIDMGSNDLNNVGTVNGQNGIFSNEVRGANGDFGGNVTAGGQVRGSSVRADGGMSSGGDMSAGGNIYANGQVTASTVRSNGNVSAGGVIQLDQINFAGVGCYPNGQVSRDISGGVLSCQNGSWQAPTGKDTGIDIYQCPYSICDNNSASTCGGQLSTQNYCQCRQSGMFKDCPFVGRLIVK